MTMPDAPGKYVVPGGYIDWDENGWNALRREVYEETSFLIDKYDEYLIYNNDKEPFYIMTEPKENKQNICLNYCLAFDFEKIGLPNETKKYIDKEVAKIKWIPINEIEIYDWAFSHDIRISAALEKFKKTYIR